MRCIQGTSDSYLRPIVLQTMIVLEGSKASALQSLEGLHVFFLGFSFSLFADFQGKGGFSFGKEWFRLEKKFGAKLFGGLGCFWSMSSPCSAISSDS